MTEEIVLRDLKVVVGKKTWMLTCIVIQLQKWSVLP